MDHAETLAKALVEAIVRGSCMRYRPKQSRAECDFDLLRSDGRVSTVEVTSSVDQELEETYAAILDEKKGGSRIKTRVCREDWLIQPVSGANINRIRASVDEYLGAIESAGIEKFFVSTDHPNVEHIYRDLGVVYGSVLSWSKEPGYIHIALPGGGGALNASTAIEAAQHEAWKEDNRKKLRGADTEERHLVVYVSVTNYLPWCALTDFEPTPDLPQLPPEITDIWVFSEARSEHEYAVWRASIASPWRNLGRVMIADRPSHE